MSRTDHLRLEAVQPLVSAATVRHELPLGAGAAALVTETRGAIADVIAGRDRRLVAVVGPCSIHDPDAALEYASRLAVLAKRFEDELIVVMRVYCEKPRTVLGWKGLINDPGLDGSYEINRGLRLARRLLLEIGELGVPTGSEVLDTHVPQYLSDLTSWVAIGARTVGSQIHREMASGLSMPVGFKNSMDGAASLAIDAVVAARSPHWFPSITADGTPAICRTTGNDACHVILRGGSRTGPNYDARTVGEACTRLARLSLPPRVMIDCSHGNSGGDYRRQSVVASNVCDQVSAGSRSIFGVMLESHLVEGRQDYVCGRPATYGQSITDPCISFAETEQVLACLAAVNRSSAHAAGGHGTLRVGV